MALCLTLQAGRFGTTVTENDIVSLADRSMLPPGTIITWNEFASCRWQLQQTDTTVTPNDIVSCRMTNATTCFLSSGTDKKWHGWQAAVWHRTTQNDTVLSGLTNDTVPKYKVYPAVSAWENINVPHQLTHTATSHHTDTQGPLTLVHKHTPNTLPTQKLVLDGVLKATAS